VDYNKLFRGEPDAITTLDGRIIPHNIPPLSDEIDEPEFDSESAKGGNEEIRSDEVDEEGEFPAVEASPDDDEETATRIAGQHEMPCPEETTPEVAHVKLRSKIMNTPWEDTSKSEIEHSQAAWKSVGRHLRNLGMGSDRWGLTGRGH
jgi:hypothetical protein